MSSESKFITERGILFYPAIKIPKAKRMINLYLQNLEFSSDEGWIFNVTKTTKLAGFSHAVSDFGNP